MTVTLRQDQAELQAATFQAWRDGHKHVMDVLPTGGGKSVIVSDTVRIFNDNKDWSLTIAHRQELVGQMSIHLGRQGVRHAVLAPKDIVKSIMAEHRREFNGNCFVNPSAIAAVGGVDTIISRKTELEERLNRTRHVTTDEGHHILRENKWGRALELCRNAPFCLSVTASPSRADGKGLGAHADGLITHMNVGLSMRECIDNGFLCDYEIVCPTTDFDRDALRTGESGDFTPASMKEASQKSRIVGDVVEQYCIHAWGKRTVVFTTDVETSDKIAAKFNSYGIAAASISAKTGDDVRSEMIRRLRDGRLSVLVNVDLLGEGFDLPAIECVIMARPTQSLAVYLQQFGRALRTLTGKLFGLVIDLVSNVRTHLFPDIPRRWTLDRRESRGKSRPRDPELVPLKICTACTKPYEAVYRACPHCGAVPPLSVGGGRGPVEQVDGDLTRLDAETLRQMRAAAGLVSPEKRASQAAYASGGMASPRIIMDAQARLIGQQSELSQAIAEWAGYQRWKGRDDSEIYMRFYHGAGMDMLTALASKDEFTQLTERVRSWILSA